MGKPKQKYVAKALPDGSWRIWNTRMKRWWGECYNRYPAELLEELNNKKDPKAITEKNRDLQIEKRPPPDPKVIK